MTDLFDTVSGGNSSPEPDPAVPQPAAEEDAAAEPEELTGNEAEGETAEDGGDENAGEENDENASGDEPPTAASGTASNTASQPAPQKPVNVVEEDVYEFDKCLITVAMGLLPEDGDPNGRLVMLGVRNHQDEPILATCRLNNLMPLPDPIQQLLEQLREQLPARSEKAAAKKAKVKQEDEKRKVAGSKVKTPAKPVPQKTEKPKPTSMNLFDMFDQKS